MRIGIDCQAMSQTNSGLGMYTKHLTTTLMEIDPINEYYCFYQTPGSGQRTIDRLYWENITMYRKAIRSKINLLHIPAFASPLLNGRWKTIVTIHDLIGRLFPKNLSFPSRCYWGHWLPYINSRADLIIVDSECTKKDVIDHLRVRPERVRVIYLAAEDHFREKKSRQEIQNVLRQYNLLNPYVLFVGNVEPRKNLIRSIRAFTHLKRRRKLSHEFVIAGSRQWRFEELDDLISRTDISEYVKVLNYVNDDELICLYQGSDLFLFPSLYEGFGLPILEAMASGVPVLASRRSSIPEVAGDAVYYVDPEKWDDIANGIVDILTNPSLRTTLRDKGFKQAQKFNWRKTAEQTLNVYKEAVGSRTW